MRKLVLAVAAIAVALYGIKKGFDKWVKGEILGTVVYLNRRHGISQDDSVEALYMIANEVRKNRDLHFKQIRASHTSIRTYLVEMYLSNVAVIRARKKAPSGEILLKGIINENPGISMKDRLLIDQAYSSIRVNKDDVLGDVQPDLTNPDYWRKHMEKRDEKKENGDG